LGSYGLYSDQDKNKNDRDSKYDLVGWANGLGKNEKGKRIAPIAY